MPRAISHPPISGNSGLRPSLALDFTIAPTVDSRITFTRASNATYFDATGTLQTASANVPRIDYDPVTLAARGLLIEDNRTNSIRNPRAEGSTIGTVGSGGVLPTNWSTLNTSGLSIGIVGTGIENGIPYFDLRAFGTSSNTGLRWLFESGGVTAASNAQVWTHAPYLRLVGGSFTNVASCAVGFAQYNSVPTLLTLLEVTQAALPTAAPLATQRYPQTSTTNQATIASIVPLISFVITNAAAIDFTLRIGAPQLELGAFATSLILPAIGTPLATIRALETATMPSSSFYNAAAATLQVEASATGTPVGTTRWAALDDGTLSNRIEIRRNLGLIDAQTQITSGTVSSVGAANELAFSIGSIFKYAIAASGTTAASCGNGGTVSTFSSVVMPVGVTTLEIGSGNTGPVDGYIRKIRYWPRALSNSDLQKVTT